MALTINTYHGSYNRSKRSGGLGAIKYFIVHYTGGTGSAKNNCIYFSNANRNASADLFVDKDGTIWEYNNILDGYYTWAVGDGHGRYGITNSNSMNVEVVNNGGAFTQEQIKSLGALYAHYCSILGRKLTIDRHYDASRKHCPEYYVDNGRWEGLMNAIASGNASAVATAPAQPAQPSHSEDIEVDGKWGKDTTRRLQKVLGTPQDGIVSSQCIAYKESNPGLKVVSWHWVDNHVAHGSQVIRAMQAKMGFPKSQQDGKIGPKTIRALQARMGTPEDGHISNVSVCVEKLQERLNKFTF